jgi:hypothetical protein
MAKEEEPINSVNFLIHNYWFVFICFLSLLIPSLSATHFFPPVSSLLFFFSQSQPSSVLSFPPHRIRPTERKQKDEERSMPSTAYAGRFPQLALPSARPPDGVLPPTTAIEIEKKISP